MLDLTDDVKAKLSSLKTHPGYPVLLREVMGGLCRAENDELLKLDPRKGTTDAQIVSAQAQTRAKYAFVTQVEDEVNHQVTEFLDAQDGAGRAAEKASSELDEEEANALPPRGRLPMEIR
jgi:hypothetical protein